jgi:hypothetical protein
MPFAAHQRRDRENSQRGADRSATAAQAQHAPAHPAPLRHRLANIAVMQRLGGYIPDVDGPYGHEFSDGSSTAGAGFGNKLKDDLYDLNAGRVPAENHDLVHISDEDDETMLTRERSAIAEVDHIYPTSLGGSSSHRNAAILSAESNNHNSNAYPKELDNDYDGTRVLMGTASNAAGVFRGNFVAFTVPAYQQFEVTNAGVIDMSGYTYNVSTNGGQAVNANGPANMTPAEARTLGILPNNIADPV